jgi:hypothetical protein
MIGVMRGKWLSGAVLGAILSLLPLACAGDKFESGAGCNEAVDSCEKGTTCWVNQGVTGYECLPSGKGLQGDSCLIREGIPTCADGLFCVPLRKDATIKNCSPLCDPSDGNSCKKLTAAAQCERVNVRSLGPIYACVLP